MPLTIAPIAAPSSGPALERIRQTGRFTIGYHTDAPPFSYRDDSGGAAGYSAALCRSVADALKRELGMAALKVEWVPLPIEARFRAVQEGTVDLLCGAETATLVRRREVAFSIPIFPGGVGALVRTDAPARLRQALAGTGETHHPIWRASAGQALTARAFSAVNGTTFASWLRDRIDTFKVVAKVSLVESDTAGVDGVVARQSDVFFGERGALLDAARRHPSSKDLMMIDRLYTVEPIALGLARGDEDFRLFVDRALSRLYRSEEIDRLYAKSFGEPSDSVLSFFRWSAMPE
jgi:putrescine:ornithine antiporter